jgi:hypothetical protein
VIWKFDIFVTCIYLPLLPGDAEPADAGSAELEPVATFMEHEGGILIIVLLGLGFHLIFVLRQNLLVLFLGIRQWES